jgi:hypothetical protein
MASPWQQGQSAHVGIDGESNENDHRAPNVAQPLGTGFVPSGAMQTRQRWRMCAVPQKARAAGWRNGARAHSQSATGETAQFCDDSRRGFAQGRVGDTIGTVHGDSPSDVVGVSSAYCEHRGEDTGQDLGTRAQQSRSADAFGGECGEAPIGSKP